MGSKLHGHNDGVPISSGKLELVKGTTYFNEGTIFLDKSVEKDQQRLCITLSESVKIQQVKSTSKPFGEVHIDNPIMIGNFPISHLKVFLLSATISENKIDLLISPEEPKLNQLFRSRV